MAPEINNYITKRYKNWLEHSRFFCARANMAGQEIDVLDEVLLYVLKRDESFLMELLSKDKVQKGQKLTELDFFILRAIKINIYSETSPYRQKNRQFFKTANVEVSKLRIADMQDENETDHAGYVFDRWNQIREIVYEMGFSQQALAIFEFKFFNDESFCDWNGPETERQLYCIYSRMRKIIKDKISGRILI